MTPFHPPIQFRSGLASILSPLLLLTSIAVAQESGRQETINIDEIQVMGIGGQSTEIDLAAAVTTLSGKRLERKKQSTVGETLGRELGVSSSSFGPGSSRPVIRGQDGDRIRILQNGLGTLDASGTSPDHAVSSDTFSVRQFEIVRGSSALKYGSSAIGGVINLVSDRIPTERPSSQESVAQLRASSVDKGGLLGVKTTIPVSFGVVHVDGSGRSSQSYSIPGFARTAREREVNPLPAGETEPEKVVPGSQANALDGSIGGTHFFGSSLLGVNLSGFQTNYGVVSESDVTIAMNRQRADLLFEGKDYPWAKLLRFKAGVSEYKHEEIAASVIETTFRSRGTESRLEFHHQAWGPILGEIGLHHQSMRLEVAGDEAFLPTTQTTATAAYFSQELRTPFLKPNWGGRAEWTSVASQGGGAFDPAETKNFVSLSAAAGLTTTLSDQDSVFLNATLTQRPPNHQELFASGAHIATAIYENGNRNLSQEHGTGLELGYKHRSEECSVTTVIFAQKFTNYIALSPTGTTDAGSGYAIYNFESSAAQLTGAEAELRKTIFKASENTWLSQGTLDVEWKVDSVQGWNSEQRRHLPRISPLRNTVSLLWNRSDLTTDIELQRSEAQTLTAPNETETAGFWQVNLGFEKPINLGSTATALLQLRVQNLLDADVRNHVSFLKDRVPNMGRNISMNIRANF